MYRTTMVLPPAPLSALLAVGAGGFATRIRGKGTASQPCPEQPGRRVRKLARHRIAMGLTGDPVPPTSRSGAITQKKDQRPASWHNGTRSSNCR
jgi:hypothetical protein